MRRVYRKAGRGESRIVKIGVVGKDGDTPLAGAEETLSLRREAGGMP